VRWKGSTKPGRLGLFWFFWLVYRKPPPTCGNRHCIFVYNNTSNLEYLKCSRSINCALIVRFIVTSAAAGAAGAREARCLNGRLMLSLK
jgi:hypothetical protein